VIPPVDLPASVRGKLTQLARQEGSVVEEVFTRYARERFLYRLAASPYADRFILKGAVLFYVWSDRPHRATRDIDFAGYGEFGLEMAQSLFRDICTVTVEPDGLRFDPDSVRVEEIREDVDYRGVRARFLAFLGKARLSLQVDVGVGDAVTPAPVQICYPTLIPDFGPPELRAYPRETVVAEKLHAIVKLGLPNSRMKDYYDLHVLAQEFSFSGVALADAVRATFARRKTPLPADLPLGLSATFASNREKQRQWAAFLERGGLAPDVELSLSDVVSAIRLFLSPLLSSIADGHPWDLNWSPRGPWS